MRKDDIKVVDNTKERRRQKQLSQLFLAQQLANMNGTGTNYRK